MLVYSSGMWLWSCGRNAPLKVWLNWSALLSVFMEMSDNQEKLRQKVEPKV